MKLHVVRINYRRMRGDGYLDARDLRSLALSFIDRDSEYYEIFNWHSPERRPPRVMYSKPMHSFSLIYTVLPDAAEYLARRVEKRFMKINGKTVIVQSAETAEITWKVERTGEIYMYRTRSPVITAVNDTEWKINTAVKNRGKIENLEDDVLKNIFVRTIGHIYDEWFGFKPNLSDLMIKILDGKHILDYTYKEGERFPAWDGYFLSNYRLPPFVGYKIGLGRGELEMKAQLNKERAEAIFKASVKGG